MIKPNFIVSQEEEYFTNGFSFSMYFLNRIHSNSNSSEINSKVSKAINQEEIEITFFIEFILFKTKKLNKQRESDLIVIFLLILSKNYANEEIRPTFLKII